MNKIICILFILTGIMVIGCSSEQTEKKDETRLLFDGTLQENGIHKMQDSKSEQTITYKDKDYKSVINRIPNDSLAKVKNEAGDIFLDNEIKLSITQHGKKIFERKFTKQSFSNIIPADFLKNSILEGMVFDKVNSKGIVYAVSVSYPQTDLYFPISLTITTDGKMSMEKEELIEEYWEE